jgi:hypothetical protein
LTEVLTAMVKANVAWVPTLDIYEASRDLQRAQGQPWFRDYLHPTLEEFFKPNPNNHGSYFIGWTSVDEAYWKENYQIWFRALREFERLAGRSRWATTPASSPALWLGLCPRDGARAGGRLQPTQDHPARHQQRRPRYWARRWRSAACVPDGSPT